jgi:GNAT superfamily N-acetyltransferase
VAEQHGRLLGFAALEGAGLERLYVRPDARGQEVGSALLEQVQRVQRSLKAQLPATTSTPGGFSSGTASGWPARDSPGRWSCVGANPAVATPLSQGSLSPSATPSPGS